MSEHPRSPVDIIDEVFRPRVRLVLRRWRPIALAGFLGALLGVGAHFARSRTYEASGIYVLVTSEERGPSLASIGALAAEFGFGNLQGGGMFDLHTLNVTAHSERALQRVIDEMDRRGQHDSTLAAEWYAFAKRPAERSAKQAAALRIRLASRTFISVDTRSGTFSLAARANDPHTAHMLARVYEAVLDSLTTDVMSGQVRLLRAEAERQAAEAVQDLRKAEDRLQTFLSRNRRLTDPALEFEARALEREANMHATLYTQLASRLAEARLAEQRTASALMAISPPDLPALPEGPSGRVLVMLGGFFATAAAIVVIMWSARASDLEV